MANGELLVVEHGVLNLHGADVYLPLEHLIGADLAPGPALVLLLVLSRRDAADLLDGCRLGLIVVDDVHVVEDLDRRPVRVPAPLRRPIVLGRGGWEMAWRGRPSASPAYARSDDGGVKPRFVHFFDARFSASDGRTQRAWCPRSGARVASARQLGQS
jgi:hypothetical protein